MINITDNPTTLKQGHLTFCMIPSNCYMDGQSYVYLSAHTIYTLLLYIPTFYHKHFSRCGTVFMVTFREHIGFHQWSLHPSIHTASRPLHIFAGTVQLRVLWGKFLTSVIFYDVEYLPKEDHF